MHSIEDQKIKKLLPMATGENSGHLGNVNRGKRKYLPLNKQ
jgi:hypothetical protein